jgi:hypothetical protein
LGEFLAPDPPISGPLDGSQIPVDINAFKWLNVLKSTRVGFRWQMPGRTRPVVESNAPVDVPGQNESKEYQQ